MSDSTNYLVAYAAIAPADLFDNETKLKATLDYLADTVGAYYAYSEDISATDIDSITDLEEMFHIAVFGDLDGCGDAYLANVYVDHSPYSETTGVSLEGVFAELTEKKKAAIDGLAKVLGTTAEWTFIRNTVV